MYWTLKMNILNIVDECTECLVYFFNADFFGLFICLCFL